MCYLLLDPCQGVNKNLIDMLIFKLMVFADKLGGQVAVNKGTYKIIPVDLTKIQQYLTLYTVYKNCGRFNKV